MNYTFTLEIPAGGDRRIHLNYAKTEFIDCGPIREKITVNNGIMPTAYGFLQGVINNDETVGHKEYVDAIDISDMDIVATGEQIAVRVVGMFEREDGDHKVLIARSGSKIQGFDDVEPKLQKMLLDFHGFNKKITKIYNLIEVNQYIANCEKE